MKILLQCICWLIAVTSFAQKQHVEVSSAEYVWERQNGDNRIVIIQDTNYQRVMKESIVEAIKNKWEVDVPEFSLTAYKLSQLRSQPKFNGSVQNADSNNTYIFIQLFDKSMPYEVQQYSAYTAIIDVKCRIIKGSKVLDRKVAFHVMKTSAPGLIRIKRYPFHPSSFKSACDTIAGLMFNDVSSDSKDLWLDPAYAYIENAAPIGERAKVRYDLHSIEVSGTESFTIKQDSVVVVQTGKKKHAGENMASGLLTVLSNIDTEKKRSGFFTATHFLTDGFEEYQGKVDYVDTRVAERRRVKDEDGSKSIELGEYQPGWRDIKPNAVHEITSNGDTISTFTISFQQTEEHFNKMWNGRDTATIDSLPAAFNNYAKKEMEVKGTLNSKPFVLSTLDEGKIKVIKVNDRVVFIYSTNGKGEGEIASYGISDKEKRQAMMLCFLSDKYY